MRIAMVGVRGIPARSGGAEHVVQELTRELVGRGHDVLVYGRARYLAGSDAPTAGLSLVTPGLHGKHLETITHTATALWDLPRRKVDVVHLHSPGPALLTWLPALQGRPVVLTVHAPDWQRDKWSLPAKWMLRGGLRIGMRLADEVTAVSAPLADELRTRFGREVTYVPNAAPPVEPAAPDAIRRWELPGRGYALYVGRIVPEKRLDLLVRVWREIATRCRLIVAGDADATAYGRHCRRAAAAAPNVLFVGPQYGRMLAELYTNAAVVVQPSAVEGMSLVLLESAAYGRCVIAADIPANRQVLAGACLYFRRDSAAELKRQISRSLDSQALRAETGASARRHVLERFSWCKSATEMERLYRKAVANR